MNIDDKFFFMLIKYLNEECYKTSYIKSKYIVLDFRFYLASVSTIAVC